MPKKSFAKQKSLNSLLSIKACDFDSNQFENIQVTISYTIAKCCRYLKLSARQLELRVQLQFELVCLHSDIKGYSVNNRLWNFARYITNLSFTGSSMIRPVRHSVSGTEF